MTLAGFDIVNYFDSEEQPRGRTVVMYEVKHNFRSPLSDAMPLERYSSITPTALEPFCQ